MNGGPSFREFCGLVVRGFLILLAFLYIASLLP